MPRPSPASTPSRTTRSAGFDPAGHPKDWRLQLGTLRQIINVKGD